MKLIAARRAARLVGPLSREGLPARAAKLTPGIPARGYNGTDRENSQYEVVSSDSITHRRPCEVRAKRGARRRRVLLASPPLKGRRASSSCLAVAGRLRERDRRSRSQPRPRCPGSAASRSTFLPISWSAPREPAPESSLLGRSRLRTSARRPSRRSMCGRSCTRSYTRGRTCADRCGKSADCLAGSAV